MGGADDLNDCILKSGRGHVWTVRYIPPPLAQSCGIQILSPTPHPSDGTISLVGGSEITVGIQYVMHIVGEHERQFRR